MEDNQVCFMCLKTVGSSGVANCGGGDIGVKCEELASTTTTNAQFSMRAICNFLGIKNGNLNDFSVAVCGDCSIVAGKLTDLCGELELLQMKVDHCLQSFSVVLNEANQFPDGIANDADPSTVEIFTDLRAEVKQKCDKKLGLVHPKVVIQKDSEREANETMPVVVGTTALQPPGVEPPPQPQEASPKKWTCCYCNFSFGSTAALRTHHRRFHPQLKGQLSKSSSVPPSHPQTCATSHKLIALQQSTSIEQLEQIVLPPVEPWKCQRCGQGFPEDSDKKCKCQFGSQMNPPPRKKFQSVPSTPEEPVEMTIPPKPLKPSSKNDTSLTCNLCTPPLTVGTSKGFYRHKINHHVETFFEACKMSHVSHEDFKIYCDHVLQLDLLGSEKLDDDKGHPRIKCQHCENHFTNRYSIRYHVFVKHKDILAGKIVELQGNKTPEEVRAVDLPVFSFGEDQRYTCDGCGQSFKQDTSFYRHKKHRCSKGGNSIGTGELTSLPQVPPESLEIEDDEEEKMILPKMEVEEDEMILPD